MTDPDLEAAARRLFWWKSPETALADPHRFVAQVMVYGTPEDLAVARRHYPEGTFREVLANPPAGLFDPRSWAYWHVVFRLEAPPQPPGRQLPEKVSSSAPCEPDQDGLLPEYRFDYRKAKPNRLAGEGNPSSEPISHPRHGLKP